MKKAVFGALLAVAGAVSAIPSAQAQGWGYGYGYAPPPPPRWERDEWHARRAMHEARREYWRERREAMERRAYEAGQRDAWQRQQGWAYR